MKGCEIEHFSSDLSKPSPSSTLRPTEYIYMCLVRLLYDMMEVWIPWCCQELLYDGEKNPSSIFAKQIESFLLAD